MENLVLNGMAAEPETCMAFGLSDESSRGVSGIPQVLLLIASAIEKSIMKNENLSNASRKDAITIFHGSRTPNLSIKQYIERIFKFSGCSTSCFVVAYIYISKFLRLTGGHLTSLNAHRLLITSIMVAALFLDDDAIETGSESLECIQTAFFSVSVAGFYMHGVVRWLKEGVFRFSLIEPNPELDLTAMEYGKAKSGAILTNQFQWCYDNAYYARIGGISTGEMNRMEMRFLFNLDFRLHVTAEAFMNCCVKLGNEVEGESKTG
ncbi:hypothetical protein DKX38_007170 [Salix brachista]|uniref:Cyclin n=1 Tax=Salix brachista TaxID=2182728 RepID=A0A5N5MQ13_9ROSI|nr:hypothetical protein DKX38_007170 [Salix brachista]